MNRNWIRRGLLFSIVLAGGVTSCANAFAAGNPIASTLEPRLQKAQDLIDNYFGRRQNLEEAAQLVGKVLKENPNLADAYVQAARIALYDGYLIRDEFMPGTARRFERLVDRALQLDPKNLDAITLKVNAYRRAKDQVNTLKTIQLGLAIAPEDPRLRISLGDYYWEIGDWERAEQEFKALVSHGPDPDRVRRNVYPTALLRGAQMFAKPEYVSQIRRLAARADENRRPGDAWILGSFAEVFARIGFFDDAIAYQRKALAISDYGAGRLLLTIFLYGKAAQLQTKGGDASSELQEARAYRRASPEAVLAWFTDPGPELAPLVPALRKLVK